jgi:Domain of unknown function (DUF4426)
VGPARAACLVALLMLASCGDPPATIPAALPYVDPGFIDAGEHRLHYALVMTRDLPPEIAGSYGIVPRRNLALLTITLASRNADDRARLAAAQLTATSVLLTGQRQALALARHDAAGGPSYLAMLEVRHRVPVTIEIRARATAAGPEVTARTTREFHFE